MRINPNLKIRNVAGENVVIMPNDGTSDLTSVLSLNESSKFLWEKLSAGEFEVADAAALLVAEYGIDEVLAKSDAAAWVNQLSQVGALL
ncbi:MAG: PqqD family peptide modification chaperone [Bacteroidales bacterium]|nr:PqqD family peptide modification chaperone [Bacteroidales bacterium]